MYENIKLLFKGEKMEVMELFKDSIKYPTKDFSKVLIIGVLVVISTIISGIGGISVEIH